LIILRTLWLLENHLEVRIFAGVRCLFELMDTLPELLELHILRTLDGNLADFGRFSIDHQRTIASVLAELRFLTVSRGRVQFVFWLLKHQ